MKKIIIITNYVTFPKEKGNSRYMYLITSLLNRNCEVELITSNFFHSEKKHRTIVDELEYKVTLLNEPGYKKNISLKRFYSHYVLARNIKKYLSQNDKPDIIYCALPSLSVGKVAARYAEKNNIRFIIDIQDLWPEAFKMVFNIPIISNLIFYPMNKEANYIYSKADDIVAVSETYVNRAVSVNKKFKNKLSVFLGTDLENFDKLHKENEIFVDDDLVRIAYIGTLGHSYDIKSVIDAIKILNDRGINNILFVVMGAGPLKESFENYAKKKNVRCEFTGRLPYNEMVGKLCSCDIAVNPITKGAAQSIINKVGDYAAAGLPVVNTQENIEYRELVKNYCIGLNVENGNIEEFANAIEKLYKEKNLRKEYGINNRKIAEEKFDRKKTYKEIVDIIVE